MSSMTMEQPSRLAEAADTSPGTGHHPADTSYPADEYIIAQPGEPIVNITAFTACQKASGPVASSSLLILWNRSKLMPKRLLLEVASRKQQGETEVDKRG